MSFESKILNSIDRRRENRSELSPTMQRAYEKATRILENPDYSIQETDFNDTYGEESVRRDLAEVQRLEKLFAQNDTPEAKNTKKIADTLEAIVLTQSEMSNWLGNAITRRSSRFDDYINKVDMIAEWGNAEEGSRVLGLAVDVTFGLSSVQKKMREIKAEIDSGKLGSIRYFKDERIDFMGTLNNVPRTVVGVSQPMVQQLAHLWVEGERKLLAEHPVQRLFIEQIASQLRSMEQYALKIGKPHIAASYQRALLSITPIEGDKKGLVLGDLTNDVVASEIMSQLGQQFKS